MNNSVSKKLMVTAIIVPTIASMADDPAKLPYAIIIAVVGVLYMIKQTILDWKQNGKE